MADLFTNTYSDGYPKGIKRSVDEKIGLYSPYDTPFTAMISNEGITSTLHEWHEDEIEDVNADNAKVEGYTFTSRESVAPTWMSNVTQILQKDVSLTNTAKAVAMYGRPNNDLKRQIGLKTIALAKDVENALINGVYQDGSKATARKMRGVFEWVDKNNDMNYSFNDTFTQNNVLTEKILNEAIYKVWSAGVTPDTIMCPMLQKIIISDFTQDGRLTINQNASEKKVTMTIRIIENDMGTFKVIANRLIATDTINDVKYDKLFICKSDIFTRLVLRPVNITEPAKLADATTREINTEQSLKCATKKGVASITNLAQTKNDI